MAFFRPPEPRRRAELMSSSKPSPKSKPTSAMPAPQLAKVVGRLERRIRLQRALHGAITGACIALLVVITALALEKATWIDGTVYSLLMTGALALIPLFALITWRPRPEPIALAQRIDVTHGSSH